MEIFKKLSNEFKISEALISTTVGLLDDGNTVPFIARYRKEATGGMSDVTLRDLEERLKYLRNLEERKAEVIRIIAEQGKLTPELESEINNAEVLQRVEDLYKPYVKKRATRASKAREKGLEPLADLIIAQNITSGNPLDYAAKYVGIGTEKSAETPEEALQGALDIIAENIADNADLTAILRKKTFTTGIITSKLIPEADTEKLYELYYEYSEPVHKIPNHRILALNRGENEKALKVKIETVIEQFVDIIDEKFITRQCIFTPLLQDTVTDSYKRLIAPSLERETRNALTERAAAEAIKIFALNSEKLLMTPPVKNAKIISIDPGYRTGCKVAVLDETGKLLDYTTIYPTVPKKDISGTERVLANYIQKYQINVISIGNGTASRETEEVVADFIKKNQLDVKYTIVNESGASVYSASKLASEEYPDLDVTTRGAMSLGRRLQDPLAELVKIPPKSIGVGQYQHDLPQSELENALSNVVENVVNRVGADLNTASASLLTYIAGINSGVAKNIVAYREENGVFTSRTQLKKVPKLGEKAYSQCAGFLRIRGAKEPLDSTAVHPESYKATKELIKEFGLDLTDTSNIDNKITASLPELAEKLGIGLPTLRDIITELKKPARDPREDAPPVVFSREIRSFEDLTIGLKLKGTVRNVIDFGAFVDIGVKQDGLVHISKIAKKFIKHPSEILSIGDTIDVTIINIDKTKGKISLSMVED